jgi:hypothetical protein
VASDRRHAEGALRLLLGPHGEWDRSPQAWDWDVFVRVARDNVILVRSAAAFGELRVAQPAVFAEAAAQERRRVGRTVEWIGKISELCLQERVPFVFTKAFQHYPDMGHDIDLFVSDHSAGIDALLTRTLGASPIRGSLSHRTAGKTSYELSGCPSPVEIHHGRMGQIGEHTAYPAILMKNRRWTTVGGISTYVPSPEDQVILQALQRIYDHLSIRLSDVVHTVAALRAPLDWPYVVETSRRAGIFDGVCCYLTYVDQIHEAVFGTSVVPEALQPALGRHRWGSVQFKEGVYRFPTGSVVGRVYGAKFLAELRALNWEGAGRLALLPPLAVLAALGRLERGLTPGAHRVKVP